MAIRIAEVRYQKISDGALGFAMLLPKKFQAVIVLDIRLRDRANVEVRRRTIRHEVAHVLFFEITESKKDWARETMQKLYQSTAEFAAEYKGDMSLYATEHTIPWLMATFLKIDQLRAVPANLTRDEALRYIEALRFDAAKDVARAYAQRTGESLKQIMVRDTVERTLAQVEKITAKGLYELMKKTIVHEIVAELAQDGLSSGYKKEYYRKIRVLLPKRLRKLIETDVD